MIQFLFDWCYIIYKMIENLYGWCNFIYIAWELVLQLSVSIFATVLILFGVTSYDINLVRATFFIDSS